MLLKGDNQRSFRSNFSVDDNDKFFLIICLNGINVLKKGRYVELLNAM